MSKGGVVGGSELALAFKAEFSICLGFFEGLVGAALRNKRLPIGLGLLQNWGGI